MLIHWHVDLLGFFHPGPVYLLVLMDAEGNGNIKNNKKRGEKEVRVEGGGRQGTQSISTTSPVIIFAITPPFCPPFFCLKPPPADLKTVITKQNNPVSRRRFSETHRPAALLTGPGRGHQGLVFIWRSFKTTLRSFQKKKKCF